MGVLKKEGGVGKEKTREEEEKLAYGAIHLELPLHTSMYLHSGRMYSYSIFLAWPLRKKRAKKLVAGVRGKGKTSRPLEVWVTSNLVLVRRRKRVLFRLTSGLKHFIQTQLRCHILILRMIKFNGSKRVCGCH